MLEHVSSKELSQWIAYERYEGPVGQLYERIVLRQIACLLNSDEKAKPFPSPVELMQYRAPVQESSFGELDALLGE